MTSPGKASPVRTGLKKRLVYCPLFFIFYLCSVFLRSVFSRAFTDTAPDLVACWCDVHGPALHSASCCLGGCVSLLWDGQPRGRCPLRGHQRGLALFAPIPVRTGMAMAQSPRAGHILRDTVICGHVYGPMQRGSVWQLETKRGGGTQEEVRQVRKTHSQFELLLNCHNNRKDPDVYYTAVTA